MAGIYVNDEGTWKLPKSIWVNQFGTWRVCKNVYVRYDGKWFEMMETVDLTSSKQNFNLYEYVGSPTEPLSLIFNIEASVEISSLGITGDKRTPAFTVGNFPSGSTVIINNNGYISGGGGAGGLGGDGYRNQIKNPTAGGNGGYGLVKGSSNDFDCTIVNTGTISGSGGGGGGGNGNQVSGGTATPGGDGGDGAGITGFSRTQGGDGAPRNCYTAPPAAGGATTCSAPGGNGGSVGEDGLASVAGAKGGKGCPAILSTGIEIAVSGDIDGGVS